MTLHSIDYWLLINRDQHKLMTGDTSTLRSRSLYESKILSDAACKIWTTGIQKVLIHFNLSNIWDDPINVSSSTIAKDLRSALQAEYENIWLANIKSPTDSNKMITYCKFKVQFLQENYLSALKSRTSRSCMCKFIICAHGLLIERGRYHRPPNSCT